jgi:hypothetical protein
VADPFTDELLVLFTNVALCGKAEILTMFAVLLPCYPVSDCLLEMLVR